MRSTIMNLHFPKIVHLVKQAVCLVVIFQFEAGGSVERQVSTSTHTSLCSYTLVINEFDVSKCPSSEPALADEEMVTFHTQHADGVEERVPEKFAQNAADSQGVQTQKIIKTQRSEVTKQQTYPHLSATSGKPEVVGVNAQLKDMESKLLEEMVRSRELNSTLARHERLLSTAQAALEAYKTNFSSVFRTMMMMERKLQNQRKINKSLDKKLSNVMLDMVEVNNVLTQKLPTGDAARSSKKISVESSSETRSCPGITDSSNLYKDCKEVHDAGHQHSDVYYIKPLYSACPIPVWCDMDSPKGGWLVLQRRRDGSVDFNQAWHQYRTGFGEVSGEHWLGNDNIFLLTNQGRYQLRVDLWDFLGNRVHALYSDFKIDGERDNYRLHVSGYSGSAHDSLLRHNNRMFSTRDRDHDSRKEASCAQEWEAGWWFDHCWLALLNGPYQNRSDVTWRGLAWNSWKREQLKASEMKIRPLYDYHDDR